jgi:hypothetical protein
MDCPVIEFSSFHGTQKSMYLPPHLRKETDPASETLCSLLSLEYQMMDKV